MKGDQDHLSNANLDCTHNTSIIKQEESTIYSLEKFYTRYRKIGSIAGVNFHIVLPSYSVTEMWKNMGLKLGKYIQTVRCGSSLVSLNE